LGLSLAESIQMTTISSGKQKENMVYAAACSSVDSNSSSLSLQLYEISAWDEVAAIECKQQNPIFPLIKLQ
jgi:hypothetical protein